MPRPPKGMFRRGSSWYVRFQQAGRDRWMSLGDDFGEAWRRLRRLRQDAFERRRDEVTETVADAAARWLDLRIATGRNPKGQALARVRVETYLTPFLGDRRLARVKPDDLRRYRLWLEKRKLAPQSVAHILGDARCFFRWCVEAELLERAPIPPRLLPRIQEQPPERLTETEIGKLIPLPEPYGFTLRLALGTGLRWGELVRANASDVERGMLVVSQTKSRRVRRIPLAADLHAELRSHIGTLVPFGRNSSGAFARTVRRLSEVDRFCVHLTRHTFACRWLESGGGLAALQQILGHASIVTTQRYARLTDDAVRREASEVYAEQSVAESVAGEGGTEPASSAILRSHNG